MKRLTFTIEESIHFTKQKGHIWHDAPLTSIVRLTPNGTLKIVELIDFVKIKVERVSLKHLEKSLDFQIGVSKRTGELVNDRLKADFKGLKFIYHSNSNLLQIEGSLHKYFNDGIHNYNDFNLDNLVDVLNDLKRMVNKPLNEMIVRQIEHGVNVKIPYDAKKTVRRCLIHKRVPFELSDTMNAGYYRQAYHRGYYALKIYDKGSQYGKGEKLLRIELKTLRPSRRLKGKIKSLQDLIEPPNLEFLGQQLEEEWRKVVFGQNQLDTYPMSLNQKQQVRNYKAQQFWERLTDASKDKNRYNREEKKWRRIIEKYSPNSPLVILNLIKAKWRELTFVNGEKIEENSPASFLPEKRKIPHSYIQGNFPNHNDEITTKNEEFSYLLKRDRICPVTGFDISMQRLDSILLSCTGLRYLEKENPQAFAELEKKLLTGCSNKFEWNKYMRMAKQIRNKHNNNRGRYDSPRLFALSVA